MPTYHTDARIGVPIGQSRDGMLVMEMAPFIVAVSQAEMSKEDPRPWVLDGAYILPLPKSWRPTHWQRTGLRPTCAFMPSEVRPDGSAVGQLVVALFSLS
jgi:hypothetical protein